MSTADEASMCRICWEAPEGDADADAAEGAQSAEALVSPCECKGTQKHVHLSCLQRWRVHSGRPGRCPICRTAYTVPLLRRGVRAEATRALSFATRLALVVGTAMLLLPPHVSLTAVALGAMAWHMRALLLAPIAWHCDPVPGLHAGQLLVATQHVPPTSIFHRSVVLLTAYSADGGAAGLIVNALEPAREEAAAREAEGAQPRPARMPRAMGVGGPIAPGQVHTLLRLRAREQDLDQDQDRAGGQRLGGAALGAHDADADGLEELLPGVAVRMRPPWPRDGAPAPPGTAFEFELLGRASWAPRQLDSELRRGAWLLCAADAHLVFEAPRATLWQVLASEGWRHLPVGDA